MVYAPPASHSGIPDKVNGWDHRTFGEEWEDHYPSCRGLNQSPIDLPRFVDTQGQTKFLLWFDYYLDPSVNDGTTAHIENDGHAIRYLVRPNGIDLGYVKVGEYEYEAVEWTLHAPSEHSLDGAVFPLELQIFNAQRGQGPNGEPVTGVVAISILFREGPSNPFLAGIINSLHGEREPLVWTVQKGSAVGSLKGNWSDVFNLENVLPRGNVAKEKSFFNYQGSLTEPPCSEGVDWWVLASPITASRSELRFFRRAIFNSRSMRRGNARQVMPLGNRTIWAALAGYQHAVKDPGHKPWKHIDEVKQPRGYNSGDAPWGDHWADEYPVSIEDVE